MPVGLTGPMYSFASLHVAAAQPIDRRCQPGEKVFIELTSTAALPYVALLTRDARGNVRWYFPAEVGALTTRLTPVGQPTWIDRAAPVDTDAPPGIVTWYAVFSHQPAGREAIEASIGNANDHTRAVIARQIEVVNAS